MRITQMSKSIIVAEDLSKSYKVQHPVGKRSGKLPNIGMFPAYRDIVALNHVSFEIKEGDMVGLIGENGAGKSTVIKIILGLIQPTDGFIHVFEKVPYKHRIEQNMRIGALLGSKSQLWWELPVWDSFRYLQKTYECESADDIEWLQYLIKRLAVDEFIHQSVRQLSFGQRMRAEFICITSTRIGDSR